MTQPKSATTAFRRVASLALLGCGAALIAACGPAHSSGQPQVTITINTTPATTATSTPSAGTPTIPAPPASSAPAGPQPCPTRSLSVQPGLSQGTTGHDYQIIDFTNISGVSCTLFGYPGVALAGGSPVRQIGLAASEDPSSQRVLVTLAPGAVANAQLVITDAGVIGSGCDPVNSTYLQIYPPNQTTPVYVKYASQACSKPVRILTIGVVHSGSGG
jgi:Protein of unknown function (DUF4232)